MLLSRLVRTGSAIAVFLSMTPAPSNAQEWSKSGAYFIGVNMGFASYQASFASTAPTNELFEAARDLACRALEDVRVRLAQLTVQRQGTALTGSLPPCPDTLGIAPSLDEAFAKRRQFHDAIVAVRESYTAQFGQQSSDLGHAFILGVNMAIAEGHTTNSSNEVRKTIYSSLADAMPSAEALHLDTNRLQDLMNLVNTSASMAELHSKATALRVAYGAGL